MTDSDDQAELFASPASPPAAPESAGTERRRKPRLRRRDSEVTTGRLKVHDPFELIRWLALSQPDPRKALAELVQNSLDAGARAVRVTRLRVKGVPCLRIADDGGGVIPELDRPEALRFIATHVGHSRKASLTPRERLELMTQGQYGIGLLGFWSLGEMLEIRTAVPGQRPHRLVLYRDRPEYQIEPLRGRLPLGDRWTEVVVVGLHRAALPVLAARRAADYLGGELRGQLLERGVELTVEDRMARGLAAKSLVVRPRRFLGERLELPAVEVPGHAAVRLEVYLSGGEDEGSAPPLAVYSAGTLVAESFHELGALDLDHSPWIDPRLTGAVEFPGLRIAPGSRRGVVPDETAAAFGRALASVEPALAAVLADFERRRAEELDRTILRDLRHAFRDFYRQRPAFALLPVEAARGGGEAGGPGTPAGDGDGVGETVEPTAAPGPLPWPPPPELFPPGPLAAVRLPAQVRLEVGGHRKVTARAVDDGDRKLAERLSWEWQLERGAATLVDVAGATVTLAGEEAGTARLVATAWSVGPPVHVADAETVVTVVDDLPTGGDEGIPEPELVEASGQAWRSRLVEGRWQVNSGHPEFRALADRPALKLRYLALLFAKEVVLRSSQDPRLETPLEQLVEVAAFADRRLADRRGGRRAKVRPATGSREEPEDGEAG